MQPKELTVCGSQLIVDFAEYSLRDVNSKKKLRKVLLDYIPNRTEGDRDSGLVELPPDSVEDSEGNSVELAIKRSGELIPRPKKRKVLFLAYFFWGGEVYKVRLNNDEPVTAIGKEFNGETYITGFVQGNQELDWSDRGEGQGGGSLSWAFLVNDKSQSMSHLGIDAEIDGESETEIIDDMVDDVFASLEEYL